MPFDTCEQGYNLAHGPFPKAGCEEPRTSHSGTATLKGDGSISVPRWHMSPLVWMLTLWGVLTGVLVVLLIYRSTLTMQEDDQLFLDDTKSALEQEQREIIAKVNKLTPFVKILGAASGLMFLVIAGMFIYQGLNSTAH